MHSIFHLVFLFGFVQGRGTTCCTDGWLAFEGSCYTFGRDISSFTVAEQYCRQHGGHLIHVDNAHENNLIKDRLRDLKPNHYWTGLTDEDIEGEWIWFDTDTNATFLAVVPPDRTGCWSGETLAAYCIRPIFASRGSYSLDFSAGQGHHNNLDCVIFNYGVDFSWTDNDCSSAIAKPLCERSSETCSCESASANMIVG